MALNKDTIGHWMALFSFIRDWVQIGGKVLESGKEDTKKQDKSSPQKKPGVLSFWTTEDEQIWAEIFYNLPSFYQMAITKFLQDLPPAHPHGVSEHVAKLINQHMFRKIVTSLTVHQVSTLVSAKEEEVDKKKIVTKNYDPHLSEVMDCRKEFLIWLAKTVKKLGTKKTREILAAGNIIIDDDAMTVRLRTITRAIEKMPLLYKDLENFIAETQPKFARANIWLWLLVIPTTAGFIFFEQTGHIPLAFSLLAIAICFGIYGYKKTR